MAAKQFVFKSENPNTRLDDFLRKKLPEKIGEASNSKIRRLIVAGCVKVNGNIIKIPAFEIRKPSSEVTVYFDESKFFFEKQPDDIKFVMSDKDVLFETDELIFVNKPAFFPVEQTITGNRNNLHDEVVRYLWTRNPSLRNPPYVGIMHRLDLQTSGVILFTKKRDANKKVHEMFESHEFTKEYYALASVRNGKNESSIKAGYKFTVEKFMGRISGKSQTAKWGSLPESKGGLYSRTDFEVIRKVRSENKNLLLIKCVLHTGRTHQIRVHLSEAGFPIYGDQLYGGENAARIMLHSWHLASTVLDFDVTAPCDFLAD